MNRTISFLVAFGALAGAGMVSSQAQVVVGENRPDVEVNLGVLDRLGPPPTLPNLLMDRQPGKAAAPSPSVAAPAVEFKPFRPEAPARKVAQAPAKPKAQPKAPTTSPVASEPVKVAKDTPKADPKPGVMPPRPDLTDTIPAPAKAPTVVAAPTPAPVVPAAVPPAKAPAVVAAPAPTVTPPEPPAATLAPQVAAVPALRAEGGRLSLSFAKDSVALPNGAKAEIDKIAQKMAADETLSLQLLSYADGGEDGPSKARRLSLSRALEVRRLLMDSGIRSTRIEVRALGNKSDGGGPIDRIDAELLNR